jgi:hypothetical protein
MAVEVRSVIASLVERQILRLLTGPASQLVTGPVQAVPAEPLPSADLVAEPVVTAEVIPDLPKPPPAAVVPPPPPPPPPLPPPPKPEPVVAAAPVMVGPTRTVEKPAVPVRQPPPVLRPVAAPIVVPQPPPAKIEKRPESRVAQEAREARNRDLLARLKPQMKEPAPAPAAPSAAAAVAAPAEEHKGFDPTLSKALAMEKRGDINGAVRLLREGIERASHPAPLYNRLAVLILNRMRDPKADEELLHKAIALEPENAVYRQNLLKVLSLLE